MSGDILAPNSDGRRLWYVDLGHYGGYQESLEDLPTPEEIDEYRAAITDGMLARAYAVPSGPGRGRGDDHE